MFRLIIKSVNALEIGQYKATVRKAKSEADLIIEGWSYFSFNADITNWNSMYSVHDCVF